MTSPLKEHWGFKSRRLLKELFPPKSIIETYLLYSGILEMGLADDERLVVAHTNKYPVYEFWWTIKQEPAKVAMCAQSIFDTMDEEMFPVMQENWYTYHDPIYRAALFFMLNRCSTMGAASCGEADRSGFNPIALSRLRKFDGENFYILLDKHDDILLNINNDVKSDFKFFPVGRYSANLLDRNLSQAPDLPHVNHAQLRDKLESANFRWVVLYKYHPGLFEKYNGCNIILVNEYGRRTQKIEACEDVLIANF